ncbi:DNRLRE domain-containing protein [Exiguobacterium sp. s191]|uniref:DNRLRE domain-containing protein n=1 Tax=Exiguobacterium sp. s191 TaxID=2751196 RepID=UPI001BEBB0AA
MASSLLVSSLPLHIKDVKAEEKSGTKVNDSFESSPAYKLDPEEKVGETINTPFMESEKKGEGDYRLTIYNDEQFLKRDGSWKDVDLRLAETQGQTIEPKNSKIDVRFDDRISSRVPFMSVEGSDGDAIDFRFEGTQTKDGLQKIEERMADTNDNHIIYKDVHPGVDVRHVVMNEEVKEDIILNQKNMDIEKFIYRIHTKLDVGLDGAGNILFKDPRDGEVKYTMPAPVMSDSSFDARSGLSRESRDIRYELVKGEDGFTLELIPSKEWLSDEDTKYPVYIDPTLSRGAAQDAFVTSADPKGNYNKFWSSAQGEYVLRIGKYDGQTGTNYAFMKMDGLSDIKGATITSASLKTYVKWSYHPTTKTGIWLDRVNSKWSESSINWENKPTSTNITSTKVARAQWATFNVKDAIQQIADGEMDDYGFKLHANGNDENYWKQLTASESGKKSNVVISYSYPQMKGLKAEPFPTAAGASTGYINLSWGKAKEATNYRLQLFNGKGWRTIYKGTATSFSTKNKKLWPTTNQYKDKDSLTGGIAFREGDGMELPLDPSPMYRASNNSNTTTKAYQFRVVADYELGSSEPSTTAKPVLDGIIPENPETPQLEGIHSNQKDDKGWVELEWDEVEGATSYDLLFYNGDKYERLPVGNETSWSSKGKRVFPTDEQLNSASSGNLFRKNGDGRDFLSDPRALYSATGIKHENTTNYYVKLIAKSDKGESLPSSALKFWFPTKSPVTNGRGFAYKGADASRGYLTAAWSPVKDASGYLILIDNGITKQIVQQLSADANYWSSRDIGLYPTTTTDASFRTDFEGLELLRDAGKLYSLSDSNRADESSYHVYVQSFRGEDTEKKELSSSRYLGKSDIESEDSSLTLDMSDFDNEPVEVASSLNPMEEPILEVIERDGDEEKVDLASDLSVSWKPVPKALKYQVMIYNGHDYTYFDVPGDLNSWTTLDRNIYPTSEQIKNGDFSYRVNEDGQAIPPSPETLYAAVRKHYNEPASSSDSYQVRLSAILEEGATPPSKISSISIPLEEPEVWIENDVVHPDGHREVEMRWRKSQDTTSELLVFNGQKYISYGLGNSTIWNSDQAKIYQNEDKLSLQMNGPASTSLPQNMDKIYQLNGLSKEQIDELPEYQFMVRTTDAKGRTSEREIELERPWNEQEYDVNEEDDESSTIEDDFEFELYNNELFLDNPVERATAQRAGAIKTLVRVTVSLFKSKKKVVVKKKRKGKRSLTASIKFDPKNAGGKVAIEDAGRYLMHKDFALGKKSLGQPAILTPERFSHILRRHHIGVWDGSFGPNNLQTFFPNGTSYGQIMNIMNDVMKHPKVKDKLTKKKIKNMRTGYRISPTVEINGISYKIGIHMDMNRKLIVDQFYPKHQLWRF